MLWRKNCKLDIRGLDSVYRIVNAQSGRPYDTNKYYRTRGGAQGVCTRLNGWERRRQQIVQERGANYDPQEYVVREFVLVPVVQ